LAGFLPDALCKDPAPSRFTDGAIP